MSRALHVAALLVLAFAQTACEQETSPGDELRQRIEEIEEIDWKAHVQELYDQAREHSADVPDDVSEWASRDLQSIGAWEYRVETGPGGDAEALAARLNALGAERWECFSVEPTGRAGGEVLMMFKRPVRSYLGAIPVVELLRALSVGGGLIGGAQGN